MTTLPLSWTELETLTDFTIDNINGPTNSQACLRLFGHQESLIFESPFTVITMLGVLTVKKSGYG
jgi:hypothetical protein